jgi:hypothetical protein
MGVGFINAASEGIEVLVSLSQPGFGQVLRIGENMEVKEKKFFIEQIATSKEEQLELGLKFLDGQVEFNVNDKRVFSELAGFPLGFKGFPALVCQNVRCRVYSIEYSHQRL